MEDMAVRDLHRLLESDLLAMLDSALDSAPAALPSLPSSLSVAPDALELLLLEDDLEENGSSLDLSALAAFAASSPLPSTPPLLLPPTVPAPVLGLESPIPPKFRAIRPAAAPVPSARVAPPRRNRKRVKDELESLRMQVAELEMQLSCLKLEKRAEDAVSDIESTGSVKSGNAEGDERAITAVKRTPPASTAHDLWKRVAAHQLEARQRAEAENARLRGLLVAQTTLAERVQHSLRRQPTASDIRPAQASAQRFKCRRFLDNESVEGGNIYVSLTVQLDPLYAMVDSVLADAGFCGRYQESCMGQAKTDPASGRVFVDLASSILVPFNMEATSVAFWTLFNNSSDDVYAGVFKPMDPTKRVLSAHYTMTMGLRSGEAKAEGYIIAKQFVEETRVVNVWNAVGTCESKMFGPGKVPVHERGWCVVEEVPAAARSSSSTPMSIIRMMLRMYPEIDDVTGSRSVSENRFAHTFADAMADSFLDNLSLMHQATESIAMSTMVR